mmetsp:Transcript_11720/g.38534  ORF Transcript_11720/g.38534 Transcript_11720/m.38534 type:complete len:212 (-) Transcript_11720:402-1037(-)
MDAEALDSERRSSCGFWRSSSMNGPCGEYGSVTFARPVATSRSARWLSAMLSVTSRPSGRRRRFSKAVCPRVRASATAVSTEGGVVRGASVSTVTFSPSVPFSAVGVASSRSTHPTSSALANISGKHAPGMGSNAASGAAADAARYHWNAQSVQPTSLPLAVSLVPWCRTGPLSSAKSWREVILGVVTGAAASSADASGAAGAVAAADVDW